MNRLDLNLDLPTDVEIADRILAALPDDVAATIHAYVTITMVRSWPSFLTFELADDLLSIHVKAGTIAATEITPLGRMFQADPFTTLTDDNPVVLVSRILAAWGLTDDGDKPDDG